MVRRVFDEFNFEISFQNTCAAMQPAAIPRATKRQLNNKFPAFFEVYKTSTYQISRRYH